MDQGNGLDVWLKYSTKCKVIETIRRSRKRQVFKRYSIFNAAMFVNGCASCVIFAWTCITIDIVSDDDICSQDCNLYNRASNISFFYKPSGYVSSINKM